MTELRTARLRLRRWRADDAPLLAALNADPEVVRYVEPDLIGAAPERLAHRLPRMLAGYENDPPTDYWAVFEGDAFAGFVFVRPDAGGWELGYRLRRAVWGRGLATEACRAAIDHVDARHGPVRVHAELDPANGASARVLIKLGFVPTGTTADGELGFERRCE